MNIEKKILDFIKSKNKKKEISGLRGLIKTGENEWSFRFVYRDGDFLSLSKIIKITLNGLGATPKLVIKKVLKNKKENYVRIN